MKTDRPGDFLWEEWDGSGYDQKVDCSIVYYTFDHIDLENDLIRRALASALQRDGVAISLGDGFNLIDKCFPNYGWAGIIKDEERYVVCNSEAETEYGDIVDPILPITWIEI
jgi:hypothetical protein